jgi:hypothetical protein
LYGHLVALIHSADVIKSVSVHISDGDSDPGFKRTRGQPRSPVGKSNLRKSGEGHCSYKQSRQSGIFVQVFHILLIID